MNDEAQLEVRYVPIGDVKPWEKNPKKHNIPAIIASIKRFGRMKPISVQKGTMMVIAGHGRLEAMKQMGFETIPITEHEMPNAEAKAYALVDNETTISGGWDDALLKVDLQEIKLELPDLDMADFGFSERQRGVVAKEDNFDTEAALNQIEEPITQLGDVITLGEHRLMCGDSTKKEDVERLMEGKKAQICFTSPPYNVGHLDIEGDESTKKKYRNDDDNKTEDEYFGFIKTNVSLMSSVCDEVFYNIGLYQNNKRAVIRLVMDNLERFKDIIYWVKPNGTPVIQEGVLNNNIEWIMVFGDGGKRKFVHAQFKRGTQYNTISCPTASSNEFSKTHKATMPMAIPANIIPSYTEKDSVVVDCFGGSGTTLIACEQTKRKCYMMELDPVYCDVIVKRWEQLTGKKAVRPSPAK